MDKVVLLNPSTCGIYKNGGVRFKINPTTGLRTEDVDNEMADHVAAFLAGQHPPGLKEVSLEEVFERRVLVPRYYDDRWVSPFLDLCEQNDWRYSSLGELVDDGVITVGTGHGSPGNDARSGHIPYVKVSDIRSLRVNTNPTNLVSEAVARRFWRGDSSGLQAWDLITPNRASSNIGEFAILLPGEERIVLTKEMFVVRVVANADSGWSPFFLLWALTLRAVRNQWRRVTLMQTNREDVGKRYREVLIPIPKSLDWAEEVSKDFKIYFSTLAAARQKFFAELSASGLQYIASATSTLPAEAIETETGESNPESRTE